MRRSLGKFSNLSLQLVNLNGLFIPSSFYLMSLVGVIQLQSFHFSSLDFVLLGQSDGHVFHGTELLISRDQLCFSNLVILRLIRKLLFNFIHLFLTNLATIKFVLKVFLGLTERCLKTFNSRP